MFKFKRKEFYIQAKLFDLIPDSLTQQQVDSIESVFNYWETKNIDNKYFLAYIFATIKHECGDTWVPIEEKGSNNYLSKYFTNPTLKRWLSNLRLSDSWVYKGRGFCQITGRGLYKKIGDLIGVDLINHPELALQPDVASKIIIDGMLQGWFTGKKLLTYYDRGIFDSNNARRIINGIDKASVISNYYIKFTKCLSY
jgi:predicted chitinase